MRIIKQPAAFAAISELRTRVGEILSQLKETPVTLEKHNKPVAVLEDPERYAAMQEALEAATDVLLAFEARAREAAAKPSRYETLEAAETKFL